MPDRNESPPIAAALDEAGRALAQELANGLAAFSTSPKATADAAGRVVARYLDALHTPTVEADLLDVHGRTMAVFSARQVIEAIRPEEPTR